MNVVSVWVGGAGAAREVEQRRMREVRARVNDFILKTLNRVIVIGAGSGLKILTGILYIYIYIEQSGAVSCL